MVQPQLRDQLPPPFPIHCSGGLSYGQTDPGWSYVFSVLWFVSDPELGMLAGAGLPSHDDSVCAWTAWTRVGSMRPKTPQSHFVSLSAAPTMPHVDPCPETMGHTGQLLSQYKSGQHGPILGAHPSQHSQIKSSCFIFGFHHQNVGRWYPLYPKQHVCVCGCVCVCVWHSFSTPMGYHSQCTPLGLNPGPLPPISGLGGSIKRVRQRN